MPRKRAKKKKRIRRTTGSSIGSQQKKNLFQIHPRTHPIFRHLEPIILPGSKETMYLQILAQPSCPSVLYRLINGGFRPYKTIPGLDRMKTWPRCAKIGQFEWVLIEPGKHTKLFKLKLDPHRLVFSVTDLNKEWFLDNPIDFPTTNGSLMYFQMSQRVLCEGECAYFMIDLKNREWHEMASLNRLGTMRDNLIKTVDTEDSCGFIHIDFEGMVFEYTYTYTEKEFFALQLEGARPHMDGFNRSLGSTFFDEKRGKMILFGGSVQKKKDTRLPNRTISVFDLNTKSWMFPKNHFPLTPERCQNMATFTTENGNRLHLVGGSSVRNVLKNGPHWSVNIDQLLSHFKLRDGFAKGSKMNPDLVRFPERKSRFKEWIQFETGQMKLSMYLDLFEKEGLDDIYLVVNGYFTRDRLKSIGITNEMHLNGFQDAIRDKCDEYRSFIGWLEQDHPKIADHDWFLKPILTDEIGIHSMDDFRTMQDFVNRTPISTSLREYSPRIRFSRVIGSRNHS